MRSPWSWIMDRKKLSMEKHEIRYAKILAKFYFSKAKNEKGTNVKVNKESLKRLCSYVIKK